MPSIDFPAHHLGCFTIYHEQILAELLKTAVAVSMRSVAICCCHSTHQQLQWTWRRKFFLCLHCCRTEFIKRNVITSTRFIFCFVKAQKWVKFIHYFMDSGKMKVNFFQYFHMSLKAYDKLPSLFQEGICGLKINMRCVPPAKTC